MRKRYNWNLLVHDEKLLLLDSCHDLDISSLLPSDAEFLLCPSFWFLNKVFRISLYYTYYGVYNGIWQNTLEGADFHLAWYAFVLKIWHFRTKSLIQIFYSKSQSRASFWWFDRFQLFVVLKIWQNRTDFGSNLSNLQNVEQKSRHVSHFGSSFWWFDKFPDKCLVYAAN